jgi:hypothetical protein
MKSFEYVEPTPLFDAVLADTPQEPTPVFDGLVSAIDEAKWIEQALQERLERDYRAFLESIGRSAVYGIVKKGPYIHPSSPRSAKQDSHDSTLSPRKIGKPSSISTPSILQLINNTDKLTETIYGLDDEYYIYNMYPKSQFIIDDRLIGDKYSSPEQNSHIN